jgi:hypothetical protein
MTNSKELAFNQDIHPYLMLIQSLNRQVDQMNLDTDLVDWAQIDELGNDFQALLPNEANPAQPAIPITGFRNFDNFVKRLNIELYNIFYESQDIPTPALSDLLIDTSIPSNPTVRSMDSILNTDKPADVVKIIKLAGIVLPIVDRNKMDSTSPFKISQSGLSEHSAEIVKILSKE